MRLHIALPALAALAALVSCGGGGGGSDGGASSPPSAVTPAPAPAPAPPAVIVTGTAATGQPLSAASISLMDSKGASMTTRTAANGSYSVDASGLTPPLVVRATGTQQASSATYAGAYSGTFAGAMGGSFSITLAAQGIVSACLIQTPQGSFSCAGTVDSSGSFALSNASVGVSLAGAVTNSCATVSGTWKDAASGASGTFSGNGTCAGPVKVNMVSAMDTLSPGTNTVNVTPLTTVISASLSSSGEASDLDPVADGAKITSSLSTVDSDLQNSLAPMMQAIGVNGSPIRTPFSADGTGFDKLYDNILVGESAKGKYFVGPKFADVNVNNCPNGGSQAGCAPVYSNPATQTSTNPNLCGSDIATGVGIPCDPTEAIDASPAVALPISADGALAISGPGVRYGAPDSTKTPISAGDCAALRTSLNAIIGVNPSSSSQVASWGTLISLVRTAIAQADAAAALSGVSAAGVDAAGTALIGQLQRYMNYYGNQFWGNQCPGTV